MSQQEVIDVLLKAKKPLSNEEMANKLKINISNVANSTRRLRKSKEIAYCIYFNVYPNLPIKYFMTEVQKKEYR